MVTELATITDIENPPAQLSERDKKFLEVLMDEADGDLKTAKKLAGYPQNMPIKDIVDRLKEPILQTATAYLALKAPSAIKALVDVVEGKDEGLGVGNRLKAATEILDRIGIVKTVKSQVSHEYKGGVALLPPKQIEDY